MHRNVTQFALLALLGATLPTMLFPAPPCYSRQDQQPAQVGQLTAQRGE